MSERWFRVIVASLSAFAHFMAFLQFKWSVTAGSLPLNWKNSFLGLLIISFLIAFVMPCIHNQRWARLLMFGQGSIVFIGGQILGDYFGIQLTLGFMLILEAFSYTPFWFALIYSFLFFLLTALCQIPITFFGMTLPDISWSERLQFVIFMIFVITLGGLLSYQRENQISSTELHHRLDDATLELAKTNMKLQEYAIAAEQEATIKERKRVSREIHDTLAYTLTNLVMMMEAAIDLATSENIKLIHHLESARDQAKEGLVEVRYALQALRPARLGGFNGLSAIQCLVKAFEKATQIKVELETANLPLFLGEEMDQTIYRLVQEGMTNALRHGKANFISIIFSKDDGKLYVTIKDNGLGSDNNGARTGFGLLGMQERIEKLGGQLEIFSIPKRGFTLKAWFPLTEE
jgi:signal transduction histidine kinase